MEGWLFFLGFIFVCGIIWGIVKGQEDRERAQERGLTFDERINNMTDFTPTQKVNGVMNMYVFAVDKNHRKVAYLEEQQETYIPFEDIISIEIVEDNTTLASKSTMRTVGGAISGNCSKGRLAKPMIPTNTISTEMTQANIGLSIKVLTFISLAFCFLPLTSYLNSFLQ